MKSEDLLRVWDVLIRDADKPTLMPMSEDGWRWALKTAKKLGMVPIKHPRLGGPVFRKRRKTDP